MSRRSKAGVLVAVGSVAVALMLAGASLALAAKSANLVKNGGAESGQAAVDDTQIVAPTGWVTTGEFTAVLYGATGGFPDATVSAAINGGKAFFAGGNAAVSTATQSRAVPSGWSASVKGGQVKAVLSADLGGFASQADHAVVTAVFLNKKGHTVASFKVGPVSTAARKSQTTLLARTATRTVPVSTRKIRLVVTSTRVDGTYNDGYADNVSLVLKR